MPFQSQSPATGELLATFPIHSAANVEARLTAATTAAEQWRHIPVAERAAVLRPLADALLAHAPELARLAALEMGKPLAQGRAEVRKCADACRYFADHAPALLADEVLPVAPGGTGRRLLTYDPLGVVLGVMPWNFPYWQVIRFAVPTLAAGNAVLVKHAPNVPQSAALLEQIFQETLPTGLYADLRVEPETIASLLADARIRAVSLTGSERAGASVAATAGHNLKPAVLELGGSDAFVVLDDADLDAAAETAARSRLLNAGQSCIAAKRFIVHKSISEAFLNRFLKHLRAARTGDPLADDDTSIDYGPLARLDLAQQLTRQVEASVEAGARVVLAGGQPSPDSCFFYPIVLTDVPPGCPAYAEELFGPVATVLVAADDADAIRLANDTTYGLGGTVWSTDAARAERIARALRTGTVVVNGLMASSPELPFGGLGRSGYGRELGHLGIREFTSSKTLVLARE